MPRFIILEHTGAPDDPAGLHFDLLLEDGDACRTWRLATLPEPGGPPVAATALPRHRLAWLDHDTGKVSGGRGFARRVDAGTYEPVNASTPAADAFATVDVTLHGARVAGRLVLDTSDGRWQAGMPAGNTGFSDH